MKVLILLALIGASLAYTPGTEYRYQYEGRLGMGIPEIKNKFSGVGIKTLVTVQVQDTETAIIKLSNIHVGEYVGDNGISVTNPLPIHYSPLSGQGRILEEPFKVFLKKNNNEVMVVPKADQEWMLNLRKSIAHLFLIEPVRGNMRVSEVETHKAFTIYEPTIFGRCSVDYVIVPVQEQQTVQYQPRTTADEFLMTRTINFDKCEHEEVQLMHTSIKNLTDVTKNLFHNVASRQSVMTVKLVRVQDKLVIKEENVQGYFSINPFGVPTDKLMSITNQTLILESVNKISTRLDVPRPNHIVNTWYMEVASPYSAPRYPIPFVNFYGHKDATYTPLMDINVVTGIPLHPSYFQKFQVTLEKLMDEVAHLMLTVGPVPTGKIHPFSTHEGKITSILDTATEVVRGIDLQTLEHLFEKYFNERSEIGEMKLKMFIDVCAASGAPAPIKMLLNQMIRHKITPERITSIFVTLPNTFIATPIIPDLLKFVKTLDMEAHPIMTTNVLVNVATILKKVCIVKETTPYQIYGKEQCDKNIISHEFIPFLTQVLEKTRHTYEQRVIVKTLVNLEVPEVVDILAKIIKGQYHVTVKEIAVLAFTKPVIQELIKKEQIFNVLMPIVENIMEEPVLRQQAIIALVTCRPTASWWQRLAVSTWREPSKNVASFIYHLIKTNYHNTDPLYNHEARIAHFILPLTKPFPPSTTYTTLYSRFNPELHSSLFLRTHVMKDDESPIPRELYTQLISNLGGVRIPLLETVFSTNVLSDSQETMMENEHVNKMVPEHMQRFVRNAFNRRHEEIFEDMKTERNPRFFNTVQNTLKDSTLFVRLFENLQFIAPLNQKTIPLPFNPESFEYLKTLMSGKTLQLSKFFNPTPVEVIIPTEIGLPFIGKLSTPTVQSAEGKIEFIFEGMKKPSFMNLIASQSLKVDVMTNYKLASKVVTDFQTILPWNEKIIASGVENLISVNLPLKMRMTLETQGNLKNVSFTIIPTQEKEFEAIHLHNIPYVVSKNMWPGQLIPEFEKFELITVKETEQPIHQNKVVFDKHFTGVDAAIFHEGDVPFPYTYGNILEHIRYPHELVSKIVSPTTKLFSSSLVFNFATSETKAIHPSIAFTFPLFFEEEKVPMYQSHVTKDEEKAFVMRLLTTGHESRFFETVYQKKLVSRDEETKKFEIMHKYVQQLPRVKPEVYCMLFETIQPTFYDLPTLFRQITSRNMEYSFMGKIVGGESCNDAQLAVVKGVFKVSNDKKSVLVEEIKKELNINRNSVVNSVIKFDQTPVYDQTYIVVNFNERLPTVFTNMTYQLYDVLRGSQFPHIENNYYHVRNPEGKITIQGERFLDSAWNLRVELPKENINLQHFELPFIYKLKALFLQDNILENEYETETVSKYMNDEPRENKFVDNFYPKRNTFENTDFESEEQMNKIHSQTQSLFDNIYKKFFGNSESVESNENVKETYPRRFNTFEDSLENKEYTRETFPRHFNIFEDSSLEKNEYTNEVYPRRHFEENSLEKNEYLKNVFPKQNIFENSMENKDFLHDTFPRHNIIGDKSMENNEYHQDIFTRRNNIFDDMSLENKEYVRETYPTHRNMFDDMSLENKEYVKETYPTHRNMFDDRSLENKEYVRETYPTHRNMFDDRSLENKEYVKETYPTHRNMFDDKFENRVYIQRGYPTTFENRESMPELYSNRHNIFNTGFEGQDNVNVYYHQTPFTSTQKNRLATLFGLQF